MHLKHKSRFGAVHLKHKSRFGAVHLKHKSRYGAVHLKHKSRFGAVHLKELTKTKPFATTIKIITLVIFSEFVLKVGDSGQLKFFWWLTCLLVDQ